MLQVFNKIDKVKEEWDKVNSTFFLHSSFLEIFYINHPKIKHLFVMDKDIRLYGHIFVLRFDKTSRYLRNKVFSFFIRFIKFDVLYLTNTFITNIPAFISNKNINLDKLLSAIQHHYNLLVVPDFLLNNMTVSNNDFFKIEVEEDMVLEIRDKWVDIDSYIYDLRKKYRNKIKKFTINSNKIEIRTMNENDIKLYSEKIQDLFFQVINESNFTGPLFNTDSFSLLIKKDIFKLYGYFVDNNLIAFSSEIHQDKILYSYYVGFEKSLNKVFSIYPRILIETINNAITLKKDKVIFGRTANEFKSNFGARPVKSHVYIKVNNRYLRIILYPILKRLTLKKWKKRNPFKENV